MKMLLIVKKAFSKKAMFLVVFAALFLTPVLAYSQSDPITDDDLDLPCGGDDPYATECPVDTWNSALVVAGLVLGTYSVYASRNTKVEC
jgi:hypothetical protein